MPANSRWDLIWVLKGERQVSRPQPTEQDFGIAVTGGEVIIRAKLQYITRDRPA